MNKYTIDLANTCLGCKKPSCQTGCPVGTPIETMIRMFLNGEIKEAGKMLFENNPLSVICSLVCPHEKHCEGHCVLNKRKTAVSVGQIEHYISDFYMNSTEFVKPEPNGHNVAIVGSGPAGIALAFILASKGYGITMYDGQSKIGGVLRYGIPDFRLDKRVLDKLISRLKQLGVKIRRNIMIGKHITIDDLFRDGFEAIFVSIGVNVPKKLDIKGESLGHVHFAVNYLKDPETYDLHGRVIILGAGNVAMDAARTAVRNGAKEVIVMYRKGEENMPAEKHEIECAKIDGVKFDFYKEPVEIVEDGLIYKKTDEDGVTGHEPADAIFISISQNPNDILVKNAKINVNEKGLINLDDSGMTSRPGVFSAGDIVTGARTVVEAVALSKKVAVSIEEYIATLD
jgi:glutamate synthase (NADPH/NADH) small chain